MTGYGKNRESNVRQTKTKTNI